MISRHSLGHLLKRNLRVLKSCPKKSAGSISFYSTSIKREQNFIETQKDGSFKLPYEKITSELDLNSAYTEFDALLASKETSGIKCVGCGIYPLQSKDPNTATFYVKPVNRQKKLKKKSDIFDKIIEEEAKIQNLELETNIRLQSQAKKLSELCSFNIECQRCHQLKKHGIVVIEHKSIDSLLEKIPLDKPIVNVLSILDFPISCDKTILKGRNPRDIWYIITKADIFYRAEIQLNRTGLQYVRDVLVKYMDADPSKVFFTSSHKSWNNAEIMSKLPAGDVYFVGRANAGKSSLIKSLIATTKGIQMNDKVVKNLERKQQNYLHMVGVDAPGSSHIPGYTRGIQKYVVGKSTIYDTPGFFPENGGVYGYMMQEYIRKEKKYPQYVAENKQRFRKLDVHGPKIFNGKSLYSYGGFFYLQPPQGVIMKTVIATNIKMPNFEVRYGNIEKALKINEKRALQTRNRYATTKETMEDLQKYVIPPFYGTIDIVFQDLGFLSIQLTSSPAAVSGLFQIYVPKNVKVIMRESIFSFIYKTHDIEDETGNRLNKKNIAARGATRLRSIKDEDKLHFSELIPVPENTKPEAVFQLACPPEDMVIKKRMAQEEYGNEYWRKLTL